MEISIKYCAVIYDDMKYLAIESLPHFMDQITLFCSLMNSREMASSFFFSSKNKIMIISAAGGVKEYRQHRPRRKATRTRSASECTRTRNTCKRESQRVSLLCSLQCISLAVCNELEGHPQSAMMASVPWRHFPGDITTLIFREGITTCGWR